jgi:hypothetical protein
MYRALTVVALAGACGGTDAPRAAAGRDRGCTSRAGGPGRGDDAMALTETFETFVTTELRIADRRTGAVVETDYVKP